MTIPAGLAKPTLIGEYSYELRRVERSYARKFGNT